MGDGDHGGRSQFGRALHELNVDIICANTPQAKGRVERANRTLQDRLVKELRLREIATIEAANSYAPQFIEAFNAKFAKPAKNPKDMHRPLAPHDDLDGSVCVKHQRTVSNSLTVIYDRILFILERNEVSEGLGRKRVTVCDYPDGRLEIRHGEHVLPYTTFDKQQRVKRAEVVENKRLDEVLSIIADQQALTPRRRSTRTPTRRGQGRRCVPPCRGRSGLVAFERQTQPSRSYLARDVAWLPCLNTTSARAMPREARLT